MSLPPFLKFVPTSGLASKAPAIIVMQEWWGINDQIKQHAQHIASNTSAEVVVPDLYKGKIGINAEEASHLMGNLDFKNAISEIEVICGDLRKEDADRKIGITGFCMGGSLALAAAALSAKPFQACAPFYGIPPDALCDVGTIRSRTPIQGHFGDLDPLAGFTDKASVDAFEEKLKAGSGDQPYEIFRYEKESHAFMNTDEFSVSMREPLKFVGDFDPKTQELAWSRLFEFMKKHLA